MVTLSVVVVMVYETIRIYCVLPSFIEQSSLLISLLECRLKILKSPFFNGLKRKL